MGETASAWPRLALAALVLALLGAGAYIVHLRGQVARVDQRAAAPVRSPGAAAAGGVARGLALTQEQRLAMHDALTGAAGSSPTAWFQVQANNQDAAVVLAALQQMFEQAGWKTEVVRAPYALKSGIFLLAADEPPAPAADVVNQAFSAAGVEAQYLTGYRAFYLDRKQNNPNWVGPELASDQAFVIAIGARRTPTGTGAGPPRQK